MIEEITKRAERLGISYDLDPNGVNGRVDKDDSRNITK
jgi:hypothetical protein